MGWNGTCSAMLYDDIMKLDTPIAKYPHPTSSVIYHPIKSKVSRCKISIPMRANATVGINFKLDKGIKSGNFYKK